MAGDTSVSFPLMTSNTFALGFSGRAISMDIIKVRYALS
jgi:hypothetical protein